MPSVSWLADISKLADPVLPPDAAIESALRLLREGLDASDAFLVYGADTGFESFSSGAGLDLSDVALWLVDRDVTARRAPCAFDESEGHVLNFRSAATPRGCDYVAAMIPMTLRAGELFVARGDWASGFGAERTTAVRAILPSLALILEHRLDASRADRQRHQLSALANIQHVLSEAEDPETVLTSIAGTISTVTGIDYISIDLIGDDGKVRLRCFNSTRPGTEQLRERWQRGATRPDPVRDAVMETRTPMYFTDAQNDERVPEGGRNFFVRTLIQSTGVLPLIAKDEVLGVMSVAAHRPLQFSRQEVELLEGLAGQVATAIKAIRLYQELDESRGTLQRLNDQLQESMSVQHHLARTDPLTGIPNRRYLEEALEAECARVKRYGQPLSVVMIDLDHLKEVNDGHTHQQGDCVIRHVAQLSRESCRQADAVARYGGDEFVFILPATTLQEATALAERFREQLIAHPATDDRGSPIGLTVSLGVAQWDETAMQTPAHLIEQADRAMYAAKAAGRNRTMVAEDGRARAA